MTTSHDNPFEPLVSLDQLRASMDYFGKRERALRQQADQERTALRSCVVAAVTVHGMSELEASKVSGVTRQTVRSWCGK